MVLNPGKHQNTLGALKNLNAEATYQTQVRNRHQYFRSSLGDSKVKPRFLEVEAPTEMNLL